VEWIHLAQDMDNQSGSCEYKTLGISRVAEQLLAFWEGLGSM
jgi:hypothetical protein